MAPPADRKDPVIPRRLVFALSGQARECPGATGGRTRMHSSGAMGGFVVGAMALGLAAARFVSERSWIIES